MKFQSNAIFNGTITANSVADAGTNTDKFLVLNSSGLVTYRTAAELYTDLGIGSLPAGYTSTLKHQVKAGVALTKGQAVYVTSADGTNMIVGKASNAAESTSSKTLGLIETSLSLNGIGNVITEGLLAGLDTTGANAAGDPVWLGTNGDLIYGLTNKPYAPAHLVFIGIVTRINANNGEIFVKVQNGFELKEIHDVDLITTTPINGHILGYNGTLWVNKTIAGWLGFTPANSATTISTTSPLQGGGDLSANRTLSIAQATSSTSGYLSSTDWVTFNNKQSALSGIGFIKISGTTISYDNTDYLPLTGGTMYGNLLTTYPILSDSSIVLSETGTLSNYGNYTNFTGTPNGLKFRFGGGLTGAITFDTFGIIIKNHFGNTAALSHVTGANLTFNLPSSSGTLALTSDIPSLSGYVPTSRTITINGTTYDLSANRSWTVTSMVYPSAGIAVSTGTAWGTSITDNSSNWNTAYGWGNHASAGYVPGARTLTINGTTYDLTANRSWTIDSTTASTRVVQKYTADGTTATYTVTNGYTVGMVDVYVNGIKLDNASGVEFTATNGTTVVLASTPASGDIVEVYKYGSQFIANNALRQVTAFTATAGQTVFTVSYSVGYVDVFYNGSKLAASEYTATNGTSITLGTACVVNDIVEVVAYSYTVGAFTGIGGSGTANYLSKFTASGTIGDSNIQINSSGQVGFFGQAPRSNSAVKTLESVNYVIEDNGDFGFKSNAYYNGTNNVYINSAPATRLYAGSGNFEFYTAPSGTAGSTTTFTSRFYISNSGNIGIGVTPNIWNSVYKTLQIGASMSLLQDGSSTSSYWGGNLYVGTDGNYKYTINGTASLFGLEGNSLVLYNAPSGIAGNTATITEKFRINSSGQVGIGISPYYPLTVFGTGSANSIMTDTIASFGKSNGFNLGSDGTHALIGVQNSSTDMIFLKRVAGVYSEAVRITSGGCLAINNPSDKSERLSVQGTYDNWTAFFQADTSTSHSYGHIIYAGTNSADYSLYVANSSGAVVNFAVRGDGANKLSTFTYGNTVGGSPRTLYIENTGWLGGISSVRESKKNIQNVSNIDWVYQLNPVTFNYRKKDDEGNYTEETYDDLNYGLIAEDTAPIADFLINYNDKEDGTKEMVGIEYPRLIIPLLKAIQEQQKQIDDLKKLIN